MNGHEMRDVVARAICRKGIDEPCRFCTIEAGIAVVALAEAGYLRHPPTGDGAVVPGGGSPPSAGAVSTAPSPPNPDGAHNALRRSTHDALCPIREMHGKCQVPDPLPFFDDVTAKIITALTNAGYTLTLTDDGAGAPPAATSSAPLAPAAQAGEAIGPPAPSSPNIRRFYLYRHFDHSDVSGTGVVAWGSQWPDKTASLRWGGKHPSTVAWDNVERIIAIHGHQGSTELVWLDGES